MTSNVYALIRKTWIRAACCFPFLLRSTNGGTRFWFSERKSFLFGDDVLAAEIDSERQKLIKFQMGSFLSPENVVDWRLRWNYKAEGRPCWKWKFFWAKNIKNVLFFLMLNGSSTSHGHAQNDDSLQLHSIQPKSFLVCRRLAKYFQMTLCCRLSFSLSLSLCFVCLSLSRQFIRIISTVGKCCCLVRDDAAV